MNKFTIFSFLVIILVAFGCNSHKSTEKEADQRLKEITQMIESNLLNDAKLKIDSIHMLYPRLVKKRREAQAFTDTIIRRESARTLAYCDSILPALEKEAEIIQKNFKLEKDTVYQQVGNYVYKTQRTEQNAQRTYLKAYVDENAELYVISTYFCAKIDHPPVKASVNDVFVETSIVSLTDGFNHSFTEDGNRWEIVTFKSDKENGLAGFIAENADDRIKITLQGDKPYVYYMADLDKKALSETYKLWIVMSDIAKLKNEIKKSLVKLELIKRRHSTKTGTNENQQ